MCKLTIPPQHPAVTAFNLGSAAAQPGRRQRLLLGFRPEGGWPGSKGPGGRRSQAPGSLCSRSGHSRGPWLRLLRGANVHEVQLNQAPSGSRAGCQQRGLEGTAGTEPADPARSGAASPAAASG